MFGSALITNESVTLPEVKENEHPELGTIVLISIVVVPALVRADAGIVKVPTPEVTTTPVAFCDDVLAPLKLYVIEYVPFVRAEALKVTVPDAPKQIGSATETEFVPPKFKLFDTTKASVTVPAVIVVEQDDAKFVTVEILIVVVPALVKADAGMLKVPTPPLTITGFAICPATFAPVNV